MLMFELDESVLLVLSNGMVELSAELVELAGPDVLMRAIGAGVAE